MEYIYSELTERIISAAINVHKELGPGYAEKIYQRALDQEFRKVGIPYIREKKFQVLYEGKSVGYETLDFCVYNKVVVELKATSDILAIHMQQVIGYLKATDYKLGLLLNFGQKKLQIKRIIL